MIEYLEMLLKVYAPVVSRSALMPVQLWLELWSLLLQKLLPVPGKLLL